MSVDTTIFCFAPDLVDEGVTTALSRIRDAGLKGLSVASVYHDGRDVTPHNPRHKVRFHEDGRAFFRPRTADFGGNVLQPLISGQVNQRGPFEVVAQEAMTRGMTVQAWTVFLHNTSLGKANPHSVTRNVYGDPQFTSLCPANPAALEYCVSLAKSIVGTGVTTINAEGLHFLPLEHGYHHERYFLRIGPIDRLLLGLCFCGHCVGRARTRGIDVDRLSSAVRRRLGHVFATSKSFDPGPDTIDALASLWEGELVAFLTSREQAVTEAVRQVREAVRPSGGRLVFNDPAGALGRPASLSAAAPWNESWRLGIDPVAVSAESDEIQILAYTANPETAVADVTQYQRLVGTSAQLRVVLRPTWPDNESADDLRAKVAGISSVGARAIDFYHYSFMRLEDLDRIGSVLRDIGWRA